MKDVNRGSLIADRIDPAGGPVHRLQLHRRLWHQTNMADDPDRRWFRFLPSSLSAWPDSRKGLAGLFIPGTILFVLGAIFLFNTLTYVSPRQNTWNIWAFAWILIPASVGLGMMLAAKVGGWSHGVWVVGAWIGILSLALFGVFAAIFGTEINKYVGAGILVVMGLYLLINSFLKKPVTG